MEENRQEKFRSLLVLEAVNKSNNPMPIYETEGSAGMDLKADLKSLSSISMKLRSTNKLKGVQSNIIIAPLERILIPTGLFIQLPKGYEAQIRPRSGLALKHGITVLNSPGTIDSDYRGEIAVLLVNLSSENYLINHGDRIAQMVIAKHEQVEVIPVENLDNSERGEGGFGSTGK